MSRVQHISAQTYMLAEAMLDTQAAILKLQVLSKEQYIKFEAKRFISNDLLRPLETAMKRFKAAIPASDIETLNKGLTNDDTALQIQGIVNGLLALDDAERDEIEKLVNSFLKKDHRL